MPPTLDKDTVAAGVVAAKEYAATITFMGVAVGSKITDEEYTALVTTIITAVDNYRGGTEI